MTQEIINLVKSAKENTLKPFALSRIVTINASQDILDLANMKKDANSMQRMFVPINILLLQVMIM